MRTVIVMIVFNIGVGHFRPPDRYYISLRRKPPARAVKYCADKMVDFLLSHIMSIYHL